MNGREHRVHRFSRLISTSDTGRALYGCEHPRCAETEVRMKGSRSPFAMKHAAKTARKGARV
jgi:hypothetical protein